MSANGYEKLELLIDGAFRQGSEGKTEDVVNPADESVLAELPHASKVDLDEALAAADRMFPVWRDTPAFKRAQVLKKTSQLMRERIDDISRTLTLEQGKVFSEAKGEMGAAIEITEWYAEECVRSYGRIIPGRMPGSRSMVLKEPIGPVAAFTPWNFPAVTPIRKMAAAVAAGCSVIVKASEETPGTCIAMARCFQDAGLPDGVMNIVFGVPAEVSEYIIPHPTIRKISFTGSIPVGKLLSKMAGEHMKRATMELGGHSPVIVFDDADTDEVVKMVVGGKFRNAGQVCVSPTRFYVQENKYSEFVEKFTEIASAMNVTNGMDEGADMGPLANPRRLDAMAGFVADAREHGADIRTGGERIGNQGYFFQPTVLADVSEESRIMNEEPFGPVAPITPFKDFDEVIERANRLEFGLASYAFTTDDNKANALADKLESGMVGVNSLAISLPETPFGGIKDSGQGSEGGIEGLEAYQNTKFVQHWSSN
jgi:succinate-semialdehyde dehydrogenase/glutarate-semialdehyde dehydrogenase